MNLHRLCKYMAVLLVGACGGSAPVSVDAGSEPGVADPPGVEAGPLPTDGGPLDPGPMPGPADAGADDAGPPPLDAGAACHGKTGPVGDSTLSLSSGGRQRTALVHVPPGYQPSQPARLVVVLHGLTEGPRDLRSTSHLDELSDQRGFVVVYPAGLNGSWNGGVCCGASQLAQVDDVGFISALLDQLQADYCLDPAKVHVTGFSNGAFLTHRLGCELSNRVASIAVASGALGVSACTPSRAVPLMATHGTLDPLVPYGGNPLLGFPSAMATLGGWASRDGCQVGPTRAWTDGGVHEERWSACRDGAEVRLVTVEGGAHDWFGGNDHWDAGTPFNSSRAFLDFFEAHPRPPAGSASGS